MHTTEKHHSADVRTLTDAELNEVSGGRTEEDYAILQLGLFGLVHLLTHDRLNAGLHS